MYIRLRHSSTTYCALLALLWVLALLHSCSSTRYVPEGQYLLTKNDLQINTSRIDENDLDIYLKQHPNRGTFLGMKIPLAMYNMSTPNGTFFLNKWLRDRVGEPPVLLDTTLILLSVSNLSQHIRSLGYYDFTIADSVAYQKGKKKAKVIYKVDVTSPIRIRSLHYEIQDSTIRRIVLADSASTVLYTGRILSAETLEAERDRITARLRNRGYYEFNKGYISFQADTTVGGSKADLTLRLNNVQKVESSKETVTKPHTRFKVRDIYVNTDYDPVKAYKDNAYVGAVDTLYSKGAYYLYNGELKIRPAVINRVNLITIDSLYSERDVTRTYSNLSNLGLYRTVTIRFKEADHEPTDSIVPLICEILLSPSLPQGYKLDLEVSTNSAGLLSIAPAVGYNHQNLFKGAELFQLNVRGAYQFYVPTNPDYANSKEFGISSSISLPRFLIPFNLGLSRRNIPHTTFAVAYSYQDRPDYTRQTGGGSFGYSWKTSDRASFTFNPIELSAVKMMNINSTFQRTLTNPYMKNLYEDHVIAGGSASLEYRSTLSTDQQKRSHFVRFGADFAGNILSLFNSVLKEAPDSSHIFLGSSYAQFAKFDVNYSLSNKLNRTTSIVYHGFLGLGKPYGNSIALPLEKMFFAGGANSLRGWQARTVGPGSAPMDTTMSMPNQVGDMLLEANIEYRFKLISYFEGALFLDAGNTWSLSPNDTRPGALFRFDQFYKDIAANTGVGLRLNLSFLILRLDVGFKLHDPARPDNRFISPSKWFSGNNNAWHFALNYPF